MSDEGKGIIHVVHWHLGTEELAAFPAKRPYISPKRTALSNSRDDALRPFLFHAAGTRSLRGAAVSAARSVMCLCTRGSGELVH